jgi:two-component system CitB family response regulator
MAVEQKVDPISVLIIEDDVRIAEINRFFVEKIPGFRVSGIATDEQQAKKLVHVLHPDLVLLDIYLPDMNGLDFLRFLQLNHHQTDVIMITAAKEVDTVREAIRGGVFDFLVKPLIFERFEKTLLDYREYRQKFMQLRQERGQMEQEEIDLWIRRQVKKKSSSDSYLPKGIDKLTLEKVLSVIQNEKVGRTAEAIGTEIGISRQTARRYLEYLVSKGEVIADLSYGSVGRPERVYRCAK